MEIILGIDNIVFISITAGKLPKDQIKKATRIGLLLAMAFRVLLLLGVSYLIAMQDPFFTIDLSWIRTTKGLQNLKIRSPDFKMYSLQE